MERVAIYCRLSEEDEGKISPEEVSQSIRNQTDMLTEYAVTRGWMIHDVYSDDDYAGADRERPAFNRLLQDAAAGCFDIVLCKSQSRFTRELELVERIIHGQFVQWGIRFIGYADNADTSVAGNKKARQINGLVNEWYLEDLSDNVSSVLNHKRRNGEHIGAFAPYGYQKDPDNKNRLVIDPEAGKVVKHIFHQYVSGRGISSIASSLNTQGIPNRTAYKKSKGFKCAEKSKRSFSPLWSEEAIRTVLRNPVYKGDMVQGKLKKVSYKSKQLKRMNPDKWFVVSSTHEALVEESLWETVQQRLGRRTRQKSMGGQIQPFAGIAVCRHCGRPLRSNYAKGIKYLRCPGRPECPGCSIQLPLLSQAVQKELNELLARYQTDECKARLEQESRKDNRKGEREQRILEKRQVQIGNALARLYDDSSAGKMDGELFAQAKARLQADWEAVKDQINRLETAAGEKESPGRQMFESLDRLLVTAFIEKIEVGRRENGMIPVCIHWSI